MTTSPDVTISTSLGSWVNRRGVYDRRARVHADPEQRIASPQKWSISPSGQHIELGIAESNLFTLLAALGLSGPLFGSRLLPIGTVYDPFICRGLDALNYACYQDARFILVATPSGLTLAPEGGAHQSIYTPLIGIGQPGLTAFEPAHVDELAEILRWSFEHLQDDDGGSVYLRLSTRPAEQPEREMTRELARSVLEGAYWLVPPGPGAELAIVACGAVVPDAIEAHRQIARGHPRGRTAGGDVGRSAPSRLGEEPARQPCLARRAGARRARRQGRSRDRPRRPSGNAVLAGRRPWPRGDAARRRGVRAVGRHRRSRTASTASTPTPCSARRRGSACRCIVARTLRKQRTQRRRQSAERRG